MAQTHDLDEYLARIGFSETAKPDFPTLAALQRAHVSTIPFEGLDPFLGRPILLDPAAIRTKLIQSRRGGYCFEQNALFRGALEAIGFTVIGLGARVRWMSPPEAPLGPREHMSLLVDFGEEPYLVDVGFGACLMDAPLRLVTGIEQRTAMGTFRLSQAEGLHAIDAMRPGGWRRMYVFDLNPQLPSDYELSNWFTATHPRSPFPNTLIMERLDGDRRHKLINLAHVIEERDGHTASERFLDGPEELGHVLDQVFGVTPPVPVEALFARLRG